MSVRIDPTALEGVPLSMAYIREHGRVADLYPAGNPASIESYTTALANLQERFGADDRRQIAEALDPQDRASRERLAELVRRGGAFVVTGQQAGLFTGPLLTLYKALTAVRVAEALSRRLDAPVLPLFWIPSEDHDWNEVNHTHVIDLENRLRRLTVEQGPESHIEGPGRPIHRIRLQSDVEAALDELGGSTPDTEFKDDLMGPLRAAYRPGHGMADAFEHAMRDLLERFGLLILQASHPVVKTRAGPVLRRDWQEHRQSAEALAERSREIEALGFTPRVDLAEATNLFVEGPRGRDRLIREDGTGRLRAAGTRMEAGEVLRLIEEDAARVSPGVLLGPVAQARALPVIAHVAGPGEIAYLAQSQALFRLHDVPAPVIVPRAAIGLVEVRIEKVLEKYDLAAADLDGDADALIDELVRARTPAELTEAIDALREAAGRALEHLETVALQADPGARSALGSGRNSIFQGVAELEKKLQARMREKHSILRQQLEKAAVHLYPEGRPQERVLNAYPYLIRYGRELLDRVFARIEPPFA